MEHVAGWNCRVRIISLSTGFLSRKGAALFEPFCCIQNQTQGHVQELQGINPLFTPTSQLAALLPQKIPQPGIGFPVCFSCATERRWVEKCCHRCWHCANTQDVSTEIVCLWLETSLKAVIMNNGEEPDWKWNLDKLELGFFFPLLLQLQVMLLTSLSVCEHARAVELEINRVWQRSEQCRDTHEPAGMQFVATRYQLCLRVIHLGSTTWTPSFPPNDICVVPFYSESRWTVVLCSDSYSVDGLQFLCTPSLLGQFLFSVHRLWVIHVSACENSASTRVQ